MSVLHSESAVSAAPAAPSVSPDFRLVPALIGREGSARHVWIEDPAWCTQDHANDRQVAVEDIWHSGPDVDIELPHRDGTELLAYFRMGLDPYSSEEDKRRPFIFAEDGTTANGYYMDPQHVAEFCDKTIANLEKLRDMARAIAS
ncbi:DUF6907 domain-containing protein [Streptomyces acidicola]|uniref:Uncharacterized protein n=1 Tax=Streptomyces acidicola TaxID=2596892 RepID=A0A5N8WI61_9ACTN|nr:hypothetical protein [Streptomyces acidicola]MPY47111.1 hypothetical protein [Streptomyces acidicola]MPY47250.1 hypothetical protein [Streptomyces acidicola]